MTEGEDDERDADRALLRYLLGIMAALFIGFSFYKQNSTSAGLQNTIFGIFMIVTYVDFCLERKGV